MIATVESPVEATKPVRSRSTRKAPGQSTSRSAGAPERLPKSRDNSMVKTTFYLPSETVKKLGVAAILRDCDTSDVAGEILSKALSAIAFYEKAPKSAVVDPATGVIDADSAD